MRRYNPALKSMVDNYRMLAFTNNLATFHLTDEQVFNIIENSGVAPTGEEQEQWFLDDLRTANHHDAP